MVVLKYYKDDREEVTLRKFVRVEIEDEPDEIIEVRGKRKRSDEKPNVEQPRAKSKYPNNGAQTGESLTMSVRSEDDEVLLQDVPSSPCSSAHSLS